MRKLSSYYKASLALLVIAVAVVANLTFAGGASAAVNLVQNGSFEDGAFNGQPHQLVIASAAATHLPGWTIDSGSVDKAGSIWEASHLNISVDLNSTVAGSISQDVPTIVGEQYLVTFDMAGNFAGAPTVKTLTATAAGSGGVFSFDTTGKTALDMGWTQKSFVFTASSAVTNLKFASNDGGAHGPAIDNVAVEQISGNEVCDPLTGHCYAVVSPASGMTWTDARDAAAAMTLNGVSGYLATPTSTTETDFIAQNVPGAVGSAYNYFGGYRVGTSGNTWAWVTGEPWGYTNWSPGEPNNEADTTMPLLVAEFFHDGGPGYGGPGWEYIGQWNDQNGLTPRGFVVEFDAPASDCTTVDFSDFSEIQLNGTAADGSGLLRLTGPGAYGGGSAFSTNTIDLTNAASFSTNFSFRISGSGNGGADGLAFVVQPNSNTAGSSGGGIGYGGVNGENGIANSLAVEFDTWNNGTVDDLDSNHVGISLDGDIDAVVQQNLNALGQLDLGGTWYAWVDYDGNVGTLEVRVNTANTRPLGPTVSLFNLDLESLLGQTDAFVGFSGATGWAYATHDILGWEFCSDVQNEVAPNPNADPELSSLNTSVDEGSIAGTSGSVSDADGDTVALSASVGTVVDNNNGTWSWTGAGVEADGPASYDVTITGDDGEGGSASTVFTVTVANVAPVVVAGDDAGINEGDAFTGSGSFADPGADTWAATVDYGDGSGVHPLVLSGNSFDLNHTYADNGVYTVTVTVTDDDNGVGTDTVTVSVRNVAPVVDPIGNITIDSGETVVLGATFSDAGVNDVHTASVDWAGSVGSPVVTDTSGSASGSLSDSQQFFGLGDHTVTVTVTDNDGAESDPVTFTVTVVRAAIDIDVKPGSDVNPLNLNGNGVVPIAVLGSAEFDVSTLIPGSVLAGAEGSVVAAPVHGGHIEDVNGDGFDDYVFHFREWELGVTGDALTRVPVYLTAESTDGVLFGGEDDVRINPNNSKSKGKNDGSGKGGPKKK